MWVATGLWRLSSLALRRRTVAMREGLRIHPRLEGRLILPPSQHEPLIAVVSRFQQLEALETFCVVDCTSAGRKAVRQLVAGLSRDGDDIDLDDSHTPDSALSWSEAVRWSITHPGNRRFPAQSHECRSKRPPAPSLVALCEITRELHNVVGTLAQLNAQ
jgi:hypothetical protein